MRSQGADTRSWIFALAACLVLFGGFWYARGIIEPPDDEAVASADDAETGEAKTKKARRKGKKPRSKKRRRAATGAAPEESFEDYDWEQDYVRDDRELGDVLSEPDEFEQVEREAVVEAPPYVPKRKEWQPKGSYEPVAKYAERGANDEVVEIDLTRASAASPLDEAQVRAVLDERKLIACYEPWVQKIPGMSGRVWLKFTVAPDGHVAEVRVTRSQLRSRVVEACIVKRARQFRFPRANGERSTRFETQFDFTNR